MKKLFVCANSSSCDDDACIHHTPHYHVEGHCGNECWDEKTDTYRDTCVPYLTAYVEYNLNRCSHGEDDPHKGTDYEGMYAGLTIEKDGKKYFFRCSDYQYDENVPKIIDELLKK